MRKEMTGLALCVTLAGILTAVNIKTCVYAYDDVIDEQYMQLIQEGEILVPSQDYSFDSENMNVYLDGEENNDNDQQLSAQAARANDNATLNERKEACAKALYEAMIAYKDSVSVAEYALTKEEFKETISDVVNSNPELFYIGQTYGVRSFYLTGQSGTQIVKECMGFYECQSPIKEKRISGDVEKEVTVGYTDIDIELIKKQKKTIDDIKNTIIDNTIADKMSDVEKAVVLHDYLALHMQYDYEAYLENKENGTNKYEEPDYDIYGALVNGTAVCQGYTLAYKYLLESVGVDNVGFASSNTHIWNTITIDGESYYVDCTWDDPGWDTLGNVKHKYLLKGNDSFTGHGTIEKTDRVCDGKAYDDCFWNDVNSGIFYNKGKYYYINSAGKLCIRDGIEETAAVTVKDFSLKEDESWNFVNAAKLALGNDYAIYHDQKKVYVYNYKNDKYKVLLEPETGDDEYIYGIVKNDNVLSYGTRHSADLKDGICEQEIHTYNMPDDPFDIPIESLIIEGEDTLYIRMVDGKYVYDKGSLKAVISPDNATDKRIRSWTSSNKGVVTVDINGIIKAVSIGEATITVETVGGAKAEKTVKVVYDGDIVAEDGTVLHYKGGKLTSNQFYNENGITYYLGSDGRAVKGFNNIGGSTYYFDTNGVMLTGWQNIGDGKYFFDNNGVMVRDKFFDDNGKRYFAGTGGKITVGMYTINGKVYLFDGNGVMTVGWVTLSNGNRSYFDANGVMLTGWQTIGGNTYFFNAEGVMLTGWQTIEGSTYYFNESGVLLTVGWQTIDGKKYYFNMQGVPVKGFNTISGKKYYFDKNGVMVTGFKTIKKKKYYFEKNGVMATGWKKIKKKKYYFNKKGVMQTGFKTIKKKKYYFNKKGVMLTGWQTIGGKKYYFKKNGVMVKGLTFIKGISYYFTSDGVFVS